MVVDTKKENLCINTIVGKKETTVDVEGDIIIPDIKPDILNAINTSGNVCVYKKDIQDGKIKLDGSINLYVMYMPDGECDCVRGINTSLDFTEIIEIDILRAGMRTDEDISIKSIECRVLNGRKVNLKVSLHIKTKVYSSENVSLIQEIENGQDIQILNKTVQINSLLGEVTSNIYAKDNLHIDEMDNLAEILKTDFNIINKEIKVSYNKVLAKADLEVKIMYLTEDNRINTVKGQIPAMGFLDIQNVTEDNIFDVKYKMRNIVVKANSVEEHGVYVEAQLELNCCAYETKEINLIQDLYSTKENINFTQKKLNTMMGRKVQKNICNIDEQIQVPELGNNRIYDVGIMPHIFTQNIVNNKIVCEGEVRLNLLYEAENTVKMASKEINLSFNFEMPLDGENANNSMETNIEINKSDFILQGGGNVECKIELAVEMSLANVREINVIDEINKEEASFLGDYSMVIYFVKAGDSIWSIAKKFKSTVEDISKVNEIQDANRLTPGMQLFIPKYTCKKMA